MLASELDYELPEELIAQHPPAKRDGGRLLVLRDPLRHDTVRNWAELVPERALVVVNDTRVIKARVFGRRGASGGRVELLFLNAHPNDSQQWEVMVRANRALPVGECVVVGDAELVLGERTEQGTRWLRVPTSVPELLERFGHVPLPPYVKRDDTESDQARYQTVYAEHSGSAAAPTAGMHLTERMLQRLRERDVELGQVTLHVGAGTFKPVSSESLDDHPMHTEHYRISESLAERFSVARAEGRTIVAVGTTVVRALESACSDAERLNVGEAQTNLLIQPGYQFRAVDALLTNFHAPRSTLLALVFAFAGQERVRGAYAAAVRERYRFLSYGDAMWIPRRDR